MKSAISVIIEGKQYSKKKILNSFPEKLRDINIPFWKKEIYRFLLEWFNEDDFLMSQTSGSTGKPKQIGLEKKKMLSSARKTCDFFTLSENDNLLLCLPVRYIAGKMMIVRAIERKMNLICIEPKGNPDLKALDSIINLAAMIPLQVQNLLQTQYSFKKIENLLIGGTKTPNVVKEKLQNIQSRVYETYGMTETYTHIALKSLNGQDKSKFFQTLSGIHVSVDERSCLQTEAPHLSAQIIRTNDIVHLIDNNCFVWKGRIDNIINSGGVKISPEWLEKKLEIEIETPYMIGSEFDEKLGEKVVLFIESSPYSEKKRMELEEKLSYLLEKFERPKKIVFVNELYRTISGKLKRKQI